ncbi:MAG: Gfo/Idh/MocA family protein [Bacilli bacterium]
MKSVKVGVIGCGNISRAYFTGIRKFPVTELVACADLDNERAQAAASEFQIPRVYPVAELLADPDIDIVVNLTIPQAHAQVCLTALAAGKHVYVEKPLAVTREEGKRILELAMKKGLRVASAPDTFLGGGLQTCRKLIDDGWIGAPVAATGFMMGAGPESWHPDPDFFYQLGGGPMFDMGPYYLTALVFLLGPIVRVTGSARITFPERTITSQPKHGNKITVNTPTHIAGVLDFATGAIGTLITSFDIAAGASSFPNIEIYGTEGSLRAPDPNTFGGPVFIRRKGAQEWSEIPLTHGHTEQGRGLGVADLAYAIRSGRDHRASGGVAYHVLEAMHGFHDAAREGKHYSMQSSCQSLAPLPQHLASGTLDW